MTQQQTTHIEPSKHSTKEVDEKLRQAERNIASRDGAASPAIKPNKNLDDDGNPVTDVPNKR